MTRSKKKQNNNKTNNGNRPKASQSQISECATHYLFARSHPFDYQGPLPCVPDWNPIPSARRVHHVRGTVECNSHGYAAVMLKPYQPSATTHSVVTCGSTSDLNNGVTFNDATNQVGYTMSDTFTQGEFGTKLGFKIVAGGIRIRYQGREDAMNGTVYRRSRQAVGDAGPITTNDLVGARETDSMTVSRKWTEVSYHPSNPTDFDYSISFSSQTKEILLVVADSGTKLEWEAILYVEYTGVRSAGDTISHSDPAGFCAVNQTLQSTGGSDKHPADLLAEANANLQSQSGTGGASSSGWREYLPSWGQAGAFAYGAAHAAYKQRAERRQHQTRGLTY